MWRTKRTSRPIISDPSFGHLEYFWDITLALRFPLRLSRLVSSRLVLLHRPHGAKFLHNLLQ
jgi:hypothetical protein